MDEELYCALTDFRGHNHFLELNVNGGYKDLVVAVQSLIACSASTIQLTYKVPHTQEIYVRVCDDADVSIMVNVYRSCKENIVVMNAEMNRDILFGIHANNVHISNPYIPSSDEHVSHSQNPSYSQNMSREVESSNMIPIAWHNAIRSVGQEFDDVEHCRRSLSNYSIARGFNFEFVKNERKRVTAKCKAANCEWMVHCTRRRDSDRFYVKKICSSHSCLGGGIGKEGYQRASCKWNANQLKTILKEQLTYRPIDFQKKLKMEFGLDVPYHRIWWGKELAQRELYGDTKFSYDQLRWYKDKVIETNPGSIVHLEHEDGRFTRVFVSYYACWKGFMEGCRPILFLDGTHLFDRYKGTLLAATALNGDGGMFPVAICICVTENESNWEWFLECIRDILFTDEDPYTPDDELVLISDRDKGLQNSVKKCFPWSHHSYCIRHLLANFKNNLSKKGITPPLRDECVQIMKRAAYAYTSRAYNNECNELRNKSEIAYYEMLRMSPENWANCYFPGKRYGWLTSNVAESFNSWIKEARYLPITQTIDNIRKKMMRMSFERREASHKWTTTFVPTVEEHLIQINEQSRCLSAIPSTTGRYEVYDFPTVEVDLNERTCTCREWQVVGLPCKHAATAIRQNMDTLYSYISHYFSAETYRKCYSFPIYPIPDDDKPC
ncbi:uncharacterized protein LOC109820834 [Asparagus officinalis]|uniref:uncharacterized protein LOC109820834 n=1 Tax=Asparagus officinalis TaxID=4686 RepID=UPI00098E0ACA|nr:uncharacterized protein LOC109820834 [Asparagus officinalis]